MRTFIFCPHFLFQNNMALIEEFDKIGNTLFNKRSYLPVFLYILTTIAIYFDRTVFIEPNNIYYAIVCILISFFGLYIRIITIGKAQKGTSGRNVNGQVADALNTIGIYSTVRHPLYLGNFFMWMGIVLFTANFWLIITIALMFWIDYERIMFAEESFLRKKFSTKYTNWAVNTPAFIPSFKNYKKNNAEFNFKDVIRREFYGFTAVAVSFAYLDFIRNYFNLNKFMINDIWLYFLTFSIVLFIVLRFLKKNTKILGH